MKKLLLPLFFMLQIVWMSQANATYHWHTAHIKTIYPLGDGGFVLIFKNSSAACPAAATDKYHYVTVGQNGMTIEGANKMYALALSSAAQNKEVSIYFSDDASQCYINRMTASY